MGLMPDSRRQSIRIGLFVLAGFVLASLVLGTAKGNPFVDNVVYGLWTGGLAGSVVGLVRYALVRRRHR